MAAADGLVVPDRLREAVRRHAAAAGRLWLDALPELVALLSADWELRPGRVVRPGSRHSLVLYVERADGGPAVLKLVAPERREAAAAEARALSRWAGQGAVRLLAAAPERGALLLEAARAEVPLLSLAEDRALLEAVSTVRRLWLAEEPDDGGRDARGFAEVRAVAPARAAEAAARARGVGGGAVSAAEPLLAEAVELAAGLAASEPERALLHGAFCQAAVLAADRLPWLAVGPEPVVGERAYDLAWLVQDRSETLIGMPGPAAAARRRLHRLADQVEVDRDRLRGWTLVRAAVAGAEAWAAGEARRAEAHWEFAGLL